MDRSDRSGQPVWPVWSTSHPSPCTRAIFSTYPILGLFNINIYSSCQNSTIKIGTLGLICVRPVWPVRHREALKSLIFDLIILSIQPNLFLRSLGHVYYLLNPGKAAECLSKVRRKKICHNPTNVDVDEGRSIHAHVTSGRTLRPRGLKRRPSIDVDIQIKCVWVK
jgi:hypothetical protein